MNGYNVGFAVEDESGNFTTVAFFNLDPLSTTFKRYMNEDIAKMMRPLNHARRDFPTTGTAEEKKAATERIINAETELITNFEKYVAEHADQFYLSEGKEDPRDIVPDKNYYNALEYKWTKASGKVVVSRLMQTAAGTPEWMVYNRIAGNGQVSP